MVYRPLPIMTADDGNNRRQHRIYKILFVAVIIGFVICAYYLHTLSTENDNLKKKQRNLSYQLGKYASGYAKCERNLKTSKADVINFQESNKQLHAQNQEKEKRIVDADQLNSQYSLKLDQAYQFFLDIKDMLKGDVSISEDKTILPEAADVLKSELQQLQTERVALDRLKRTYEETSKALGELQSKHNAATVHNDEIEAHAKALYNNNKNLKRELSDKRQKLEQDNMQIATLQNTVDKLQDDLQRLAKMREDEKKMHEDEKKMHEDEKKMYEDEKKAREDQKKSLYVSVPPPENKLAVAAPVEEKAAVAAPVEKKAAVVAPVEEKVAVVAPEENNTSADEVKPDDKEVNSLDNTLVEEKTVEGEKVAAVNPIPQQSDNIQTERRIVEDTEAVTETKAVEEPRPTLPPDSLNMENSTALLANPLGVFDDNPANKARDLEPNDSNERLNVVQQDWKEDDEEGDEPAAADGIDGDMDETHNDN